MSFMIEKWNVTRRSNNLNKIFMKKVFVVFLVLYGIVMLIKGVYNFFPLNFSSILDNNIAYSIGHNFGVFFRKISKIIIGAFLIKYCYDWFCDEKKVQDI